MAVNAKAVVTVDVDDKQFQDFTKSFDKFQKMLARPTAAFKSMSKDAQAMVVAFNQGTAALMAQNEMMRKNAAHAKDVSIHSERSHFSWKGIADKGKSFASFVTSAHERIMKWAGVFSGIVTGMGAATGWGLYGLGQWVRGGANAGSRVGLGAHELRAVKGLGDQFGIDTEGLARMTTTAAGNVGSPEYGAISRLGINARSLKGTHKVTDIIEALIREMEGGKTPEEMARDSGGQWNAGDLNAILNNKDAIRQAIKRVPEEAEKQRIDPKVEKAWSEWLALLDFFTGRLRAIMANGLQPLLDMITKNAPEWLDNLEKFMTSKPFKEFLAQIPTYVTALWNATKDVAAALEWFAKKAGWIKKTDSEQKADDATEKQRADAAHMAAVKGGYVPGTPAEIAQIAKDDAEAKKKLGELTDSIAKGVADGVAKGWHDVWTREGKDPMRGGSSTSGLDPRDPRNPYGSHQDGAPMIPKTGTYTLHKGEMVLPEADADLLRHSTMADWKRGITGIESGGNYGIVNRISGATGKYQVMPGNIADWTRKALGYSMSQEQFRNSPGAQERVFETIFGEYVNRFGNPVDAASAWFSGQPFVGNHAGPDAMGTTVPGYIKSFLGGLGASSAGRISVDVNDNTGGNVAMSLSQMALVSIPLHPV